MLVVTLFGVAIEFIDESADFLAAVQIIVYAGAIVILFLFVIMFLGVDRREAAGREPPGSRSLSPPCLGVVVLDRDPDPSQVQEWTTASSITPRHDRPGGYAGRSTARATTSRSSGSPSTPATCCPSK